VAEVVDAPSGDGLGVVLEDLDGEPPVVADVADGFYAMVKS
jgi:hypothetical protein